MKKYIIPELNIKMLSKKLVVTTASTPYVKQLQDTTIITNKSQIHIDKMIELVEYEY